MGRARKPQAGSLASILTACEGVALVVELRNESHVRGTLESADAQMNLLLTNVVFSPFQKPKQKMEQMYIRGNNIRMVHLPHKIDCTDQLRLERKRRMDARAQQLKSALGPVNLPKAHQQQQQQQQQQQPPGAPGAPGAPLPPPPPPPSSGDASRGRGPGGPGRPAHN